MVPPSRVWRTTFCSNKCREENKTGIIESRKKECLCCKKIFIPRLYQIKNGNGKYCSTECRNRLVVHALNTPESQVKAKTTYKRKLHLGLIVHPTGEDHPRWKGGAKEMVRRRIKDGQAKKSVQAYRKKNPDKVREWSTTRQNRKTGRLPRNTIKNKIIEQRGLCVYCKHDITLNYHVDHIVPLSKNGKHEPTNIQILCPSCNLRKAAKLKIKFQSGEMILTNRESI